MRSSMVCLGLLWAGFAALVLSPAAEAQAPPYPSYPPPPSAPTAAPPASPEAGEIAACLCLRQDVNALGATMAAKRHAYDQVRSELADLDARLQRQRATLDVNNPQAVAQFRQLLQQRDAMFRRSTGPAAGDLSTAVARYNARVSEYNARCANRPRDPVLLAQVQATLSCPAP